MGKKGKKGGANLGKSLIRDRFGSHNKRRNGDSMLHTTDLDDGYDWARLNWQSVTEETSFQEFLSTAELAGTEFRAEKLNIKFVNPKSTIGMLSKDEKDKILEKQEKNKDLLKIPRRPKWDSSTTAHELECREKEEFLNWRRHLATLQEDLGLTLTPYEKNLQFWRQLWRVIERSDVIVQIVDARNPLLFRCEDLERYVKEINSDKLNMILINKADFLTNEQREAWAKYFSEINVRVAFFSAISAVEKIREEDEDEASSINENNDHADGEKESSDESLYKSDFESESEYESAEADNNHLLIVLDTETANDPEIEVQERAVEKLQISVADPGHETRVTEIIINSEPKIKEEITNSPELLNRDGLVKLFKEIYNGNTYMQGVTTIGLVGYPNVGKSSTINALLMDKKVSVSATPGKTKHFQTLYLDTDLMLCDCPGLVMPSFICTKSEMILNGILPIDQMRDHVPAVTLLATLIPRHILEDTYGIMLPAPLEGEDPDRAPMSEELLNAHAYNRGFMTQNGQPDNPRSARYVLKDFVNGRLLYCVAPTTYEQETFHRFPPRRHVSTNKHIPPRTARANRGNCITTEDVNRSFFEDRSSGVHIKGRRLIPQQSLSTDKTDVESTVGSTLSLFSEDKPWKKINKHVNKKKREKTRRLYRHLDEH